MAPLTILPNELLDTIFSQLSIRDLKALRQVHKAFHLSANLVIFQKLRLNRVLEDVFAAKSSIAEYEDIRPFVQKFRYPTDSCHDIFACSSAMEQAVRAVREIPGDAWNVPISGKLRLDLERLIRELGHLVVKERRRRYAANWKSRDWSHRGWDSPATSCWFLGFWDAKSELREEVLAIDVEVRAFGIKYTRV